MKLARTERASTGIYRLLERVASCRDVGKCDVGNVMLDFVMTGTSEVAHILFGLSEQIFSI